QVLDHHIDSTNVLFGLYTIFACGSYNLAQGGHLILFNLGLVIQFSPGSTILVPSSTICHRNISIQPQETRQSFTQYCPGGLFHWVECGFEPSYKNPKVQACFQENHEQ
ncbi:hypothetical protein OG21DRAFT_1427873, partial [Imleria badia]